MAADSKPSPEGGISAIAGYKLETRLGQGAMGVVYRATQASIGRPVALKVLRPKLAKNKTYVARFMREARSAARVEHPNIVAAYDVGQSEEGYHYFAMEFVEGDSLKRVVKKEGVLPEKRALETILGVAGGLEHASRVNMVHRDIKPENILIAEDGTPKLADFGLAKAPDDATVTQAGSVFGTPHYASPEQARGEDLDARADIYSLGATFFHCVTGRPPFDGDTIGVVMAKHMEEPLTPPHEVNPDLSENTSQVISKMMAKDPASRYQSATELIRDLELILAGRRPEVAKSAPKISDTAVRSRGRVAGIRSQKKSPVPAILGASLLAVVVAGLTYFGLSQGSPSPGNGSQTSGTRKGKRTRQPTGTATNLAARLLEEADQYRFENPQNYPDQLSRYQAVVRRFADSAQGRMAAKQAKTVQAEWDAKATRELGALKARADALAAEQRFGQAITALEGFPGNLRNEKSTKSLEAAITQYRKQAHGSFVRVQADARKAMSAGDLDRARALYRQALDYGIPGIRRRARDGLAEVDRFEEQAQEEKREAQRLAYFEFWERFRSFLAEENYDAAERLAGETLEATQLPELRAEIQMDKADVSRLRGLPAMAEEGLATIQQAETITVGGMRGAFSRVEDGQIFLAMAGVEVKRPLSKLSPRERNELSLRAVDPKSPEPFITFALASLYAKRCDIDSAEEYLATAKENGGDVAHCETVMERIAQSEAEKAAQKLFEQAEKLIAEEKWAGAKQALTSLLTNYGASATARSKSREIQELLALCQENLAAPEEEDYELVELATAEIPEYLCWGPTRLPNGMALEELDEQVLPTVDEARAGEMMRDVIWVMVPSDSRLPGGHVRYLLVELHARRKARAMARIRWDDGAVMWVNGEQVFDSGAPWRGWSGNRFKPTPEFRLRKGRNLLLFRNTNGPGAGGMTVFLTDPHGDLIEGLKYRREKGTDEFEDDAGADDGEEIDLNHKRFREVPVELRPDIRTFQGHYYLHVREGADWMSAARACKDLGGHLVTISSQAENDFVHRTVAKGGNVWIGYSDMQREGEWRWVGGKKSRYTNWSPGQPDNHRGGEHCAHLSRHSWGRWNDNSGDRKFFFLCEWDQ